MWCVARSAVLLLLWWSAGGGALIGRTGQSVSSQSTQEECHEVEHPEQRKSFPEAVPKLGRTALGTGRDE